MGGDSSNNEKASFILGNAALMEKSHYYSLFDTDGPAHDMLARQSYTDFLFLERSVSVIKKHNASAPAPLFLFIALQAPHDPWQVNQQYEIDVWERVQSMGIPMPRGNAITQLAMSAIVDLVVKGVVEALREHSLWQDTLLIFSSEPR